ncbi:hypothetical protein GGS21DRAFT_507346 [Xylaria nigripes]|nr:hypothetical protein GGS21DRAFT_507346 [Xylaria nigripes]
MSFRLSSLTLRILVAGLSWRALDCDCSVPYGAVSWSWWPGLGGASIHVRRLNTSLEPNRSRFERVLQRQAMTLNKASSLAFT